MSLPKEPRQKMINVMYLVLTALLALNVSAEILNAFKTVDHSLVNSNDAIDKKNDVISESFKAMLEDPASKEKAAIWKPKADKVRELSKSIIKDLDDLKLLLKQESKLEKVKDEHGKEIEKFSLDNLDAATKLFIDKQIVIKGMSGEKRGKDLELKLKKFKDDLLAIDPDMTKKLEGSLPLDLSIPETSGGHSSKTPNKDWAYAYFHMTPTIAAITILTKFQNDIKNCEAAAVDFCQSQVGKVKFVFNKFQALAQQSSEYLMPGMELKITGGVGAFSDAAKPSVTIDGSSVPLNAEGVAEYKTVVGGPGSYSKKVIIRFTKPDGTPGVTEKEIKYTVGSPSGISVSADATKVFYIGLPNPISVTGGTKGDEATTVEIDNGSLEKTGAGKYNVTVSGGTEANVTVTQEGKPTVFKFRVKPIPDPVALVGRSKGGKIGANEFKAQQGLRADLENFIFEGVKYNITSFTMYATGKGFSENPGISENKSAAFSPDTKRIIDRCVNGTTVYFDEIKAVGPDGRTRPLPSIVFQLN